MNVDEERHLTRMRKKAEVILEAVGGELPFGLGERDHVALDRVLDALAVALGIELSDKLGARPHLEWESWRSEVMEYLKQGKKLYAVKCYREALGCSLKESLEAIEEFERNM